MSVIIFYFFVKRHTAHIYTLSLHDALPIWLRVNCAPIASARYSRLRLTASASSWEMIGARIQETIHTTSRTATRDRKSTRLNSSHTVISYAVFCLKKKK